MKSFHLQSLLTLIALALAGLGSPLRAAPAYEVLAGFNGPSGPTIPSTAATQGSDGAFYFMTVDELTTRRGSIVRVTAAGAVSTVKKFTGTSGAVRGAYGRGLTLGPDGALYGVTQSGGLSDKGTIFRLTAAGDFTTLLDFTGTGGNAKGMYPSGPLIVGAGGVFYGTTGSGGVNNTGTVFKFTPAGGLTTLAEFPPGIDADGQQPPHNPLRIVQVANGSLYGITTRTRRDVGILFKVPTTGGLTLFEETGALSDLVLGADGSLFTVRASGFGDLVDFGKISLSGTFTPLFSFETATPELQGFEGGGLTLGADGNFVMLLNGGFARITPAGGVTLIAPESSNSAIPFGLGLKMVRGADQNFYGVDDYGGPFRGLLFKLTPSGTFSVVATLGGDLSRGFNPVGSLLLGPDGSQYGITQRGGLNFGTVFKVSPSGTFSSLVKFSGITGPNKGWVPVGGLTRGADGNLYGATSNGGVDNYGTVYRVTPGGSLTTLVEFTGFGGPKPGYQPSGRLVSGSDGALYGVAPSAYFFKITGAGAYVPITDFYGAAGGPYTPFAGLIAGPDQAFYGTSRRGGSADYGAFFKITAAGAVTLLTSVDPQGEQYLGRFPDLPPAFDARGRLYGFAGQDFIRSDFSGGGGQIVFSFPISDDPAQGYDPSSAPVLGPDGNFYATTEAGGTFGFGTVFKITPAGVHTVLVHFTGTGGAFPGAKPRSEGLTFDADGRIYGVAAEGGPTNGGLVWRLTLDDASGDQDPEVVAVKGGNFAVPGEPAGTIFTTLGTPQVGAFAGNLRTPSQQTVRAIFGPDARVLARVGGPVPGTNLVFSTLGEPSGDAALATVKGAGVTAVNDTVLLRGLKAGPVRVAFRAGQQFDQVGHFPDDRNVTLKSFLAIDGQGPSVFFTAKIRGDTFTDATALCASREGISNIVLLRTGARTFGSTVNVVGTLVGAAGSLAEDRWRSGAHGFGARFSLASGEQFIAGFETFELGSPGSIPLSTVGNTPQPYRSFGLPAFAGYRTGETPDVFAVARLRGAAANQDQAMVWSFGPTQIARESGAVPNAAGAPIAGARFVSFADPVAGGAFDANQVRSSCAFTATISGPGIDATNRAGLWLFGSDKVLRLLARAKDPAPGGGVWSSFTSLAFPNNSDHGPIFTAKLVVGTAGVTSANNTGLWAVDSTGELRLVLRAGQDFVLQGGNKVVKSFIALAPAPGSVGAAGGFDEFGHVAVTITFTDGIQALVRLTVP